MIVIGWVGVTDSDLEWEDTCDEFCDGTETFNAATIYETEAEALKRFDRAIQISVHIPPPKAEIGGVRASYHCPRCDRAILLPLAGCKCECGWDGRPAIEIHVGYWPYDGNGSPVDGTSG